MPKIWELQDAKNVADLIDDEDLDDIGRRAVEGYNIDKESRVNGGWDDRTEASIKLALQIAEEKTYPWKDASNVKHPLVTIAAMQFSARAYPALVKAPDLVKYRVNGIDPSGTKASRAARISRHLSWQLLEEDERWEEDMDRAMLVLPIIGTVFKKSHFDPVKQTNASRLVLPQNFYVNYYTRNLEDCERKTEVLQLSKRKIKERINRGIYSDVELEGESDFGDDNKLSDERQGLAPPPDEPNKPRKIIEQHTFLDLDEDDYEEPYVLTVDLETMKVLRIVHRFSKVVTKQTLSIDELNDQQKTIMLQMQQIAEQARAQQQQLEQQMMQMQEQGQGQVDPAQMQGIQAQIDQITVDAEMQMRPMQGVLQELGTEIEKLQEENLKKPKVTEIEVQEHYTKYGFLPSPDGGFYDIGFGSLLGPLNETVNTLINQMVDSGTLQQGSQGFIGKGARVEGGRIAFKPYEWKKVNVAGMALRENIVPLPVNPPSPVLFQLLGMMIEYAQRVTSVTDVMTGENVGQNTPAYNYQAMQESGMQVFNAIFKRMYRSMRSEFRKLYVINSVYLNPIDYFETNDGRFEVLQADYKGDPKDVFPAADPNAFSNIEKLMKAQFLAARAAQVPGYHTGNIEKRLLEANDIDDVQDVFPTDDQGNPQIQPPPNPELELDKAEAQRKALESQTRMQIETTKAESSVDVDEANIMLIQAKIQEMGERVDINWFDAMTRRMRERREALKSVMEEENADRDRRSKERIADADRRSGERQAIEDRRDKRMDRESRNAASSSSG